MRLSVAHWSWEAPAWVGPGSAQDASLSRDGSATHGGEDHARAKTGSLEGITAFGADVVIVATGADAAPLEVGRRRRVAFKSKRRSNAEPPAGPAPRLVFWTPRALGRRLAACRVPRNLGLRRYARRRRPTRPLWDINIYSRMTALDRLRAKGVKIRTAVEIQRIDGGCIELRERMTGATVRHSGFSHFLQATRGRSRYDLPNALENARDHEAFIIGDALAPRSLLEAMLRRTRSSGGASALANSAKRRSNWRSPADLKVIYTATGMAVGGRSGRAKSSDGELKITFSPDLKNLAARVPVGAKPRATLRLRLRGLFCRYARLSVPTETN